MIAMRIESDEGGDPRVIAVERVQLRVLRRVDTVDTHAKRALVLIRDPRCAHCEEVITSVDDCAIVPSAFTRMAPRIAHKTKVDANGHLCFVMAVQRHNPTFNRTRAAERAGEQGV